MKTEFKVVEHRFDKDVTIIPIGDVHLGAIEHAKQEWELVLKNINDNK